MTWLKQKLGFFQTANPRKVIIWAFIFMVAVGFITNITIETLIGLVVVVLLMFYGLFLLNRKDYRSLKFLFLIILIAKLITLASRILERAL